MNLRAYQKLSYPISIEYTECLHIYYEFIAVVGLIYLQNDEMMDSFQFRLYLIFRLKEQISKRIICIRFRHISICVCICSCVSSACAGPPKIKQVI